MSKIPFGGHDFSKRAITDFLEELSSDSASPGGGAAAALTGALGVSLVEMVSRINERREQKKSGKKNPSSGHPLKIRSLGKIRQNFLQLMKRDTQAFLALSSFTKDNRTGKSYQQSVKNAASVPLEMAHLACLASSLAESEIGRTSRWLASDLAEAAILLEASFCSARLNVEINLPSIEDRSFLNRVKKELDQLQKENQRSKIKLLKVLTHG